MTTFWPLPRIEIRDVSTIKEERPVAVLTGTNSWAAVAPAINLPIVVQAEPHTANLDFLNSLADGLPAEVEAVYGVGGGLASDVAKFIGFKRKLPVTVIPTALSVDGFFTSLVAARSGGVVEYITTGPADRLIIDWEVIKSAPPRVRGSAIVELLTMVTGLLDWRYAAERNKNTQETRFQPWAASVAASIAQQAFRISEGVGEGKQESLRSLLDLIAMEVQLTNQLGHNRPQEGSEQYFAYAIEPKISRGLAIPYADMVGPGILISAALHNQDIGGIRQTLTNAGIRLGQLAPDTILETLRELPQYVQTHNLPYSILHETDMNDTRTQDLIARTGLDASGGRPL